MATDIAALVAGADLPATAGIYALVHAASETVYVGQAQNLRRRKIEHICRLRSGSHKNPHLQAAFNMYGETSFYFSVLEACDTSLLTERESHWMDCMRRVRSLYNVYPAGGSPRGIKRSAETRQKIAASRRGRNVGRKHTQEERQRISAALRGKKRPRNPQWNEKLAAAKRGKSHKPLSAEAREKISRSLTGRKTPAAVLQKRAATVAARRDRGRTL